MVSKDNKTLTMHIEKEITSRFLHEVKNTQHLGGPFSAWCDVLAAVAPLAVEVGSTCVCPQVAPHCTVRTHARHYVDCSEEGSVGCRETLGPKATIVICVRRIVNSMLNKWRPIHHNHSYTVHRHHMHVTQSRLFHESPAQ